MGDVSNINVSALSRMFSATVLKELAKCGRSPLLSGLIHESKFLDFKVSETVSDLYDNAFEFLKLASNRHEYVYKAVLTEKILLGVHSLNTACMMSEFRVGQCKADVVILNGTGTVYEIKSERDTLTRLSKQIEAYTNVFATVNVIVGENHLKNALNIVPDHVGVMLLSGRYKVSTIQEGIDDPSRTNPVKIFESIRIIEAEKILERMGIDIPIIPNTRKYKYLHNQFMQLDPIDTHLHMVGVLKETRNLTSLKELIGKLPKSLQSAALTTRLRKQDYSNLVNAMETPISKVVSWR